MAREPWLHPLSVRYFNTIKHFNLKTNGILLIRDKVLGVFRGFRSYLPSHVHLYDLFAVFIPCQPHRSLLIPQLLFSLTLHHHSLSHSKQ